MNSHMLSPLREAQLAPDQSAQGEDSIVSPIGWRSALNMILNQVDAATQRSSGNSRKSYLPPPLSQVESAPQRDQTEYRNRIARRLDRDRGNEHGQRNERADSKDTLMSGQTLVTNVAQVITEVRLLPPIVTSGDF
jgi:hypothetical protein